MNRWVIASPSSAASASVVDTAMLRMMRSICGTVTAGSITGSAASVAGSSVAAASVGVGVSVAGAVEAGAWSNRGQ